MIQQTINAQQKVKIGKIGSDSVVVQCSDWLLYPPA
jgi:hypothetical protein